MSRKSLLAIVAVLLFSSKSAFAGGPPLLCLPIDGVTADSSDEATALLAERLDKKLFPGSGAYSDVEIREHNGQWYAMLYMREDIALNEIDAALKDTEFSIPREKLRFFGHVVLEIDADQTAAKTLQHELEETSYVSVVETKSKDGHLHLTVEMPYPASDSRQHRDAIFDDAFVWNGYTTDSSSESASPASAEALPDYKAFREIIAKLDARLRDVRWSTEYACRAVGCVVKPTDEGLTNVKPSVVVAQED
jgi:hypothetical protein